MIILLPNINYFGLMSHYSDIPTNGVDARVDKLKDRFNEQLAEVMRTYGVIVFFHSF
jgi:hypothetical protein